MQLNTIRDRYEPSRALKQVWLQTRKAPAIIAGVILPGLFQTAGAGRDIALMLLTIGLEGYTLANLWLVANIKIVSALGLMAIDAVAALGWHMGQGLRTETANRVAVSQEGSEQVALQNSIPLWHGFVRAGAFLLIVGLAAFKIYSFTKNRSDTPGGLVLLITVAYSLVAVLHLYATGFAISYLYLRVSIWFERRQTHTSSDRKVAKCFVKAARVKIINTGTPLVPCTANGHALSAPEPTHEGVRHTLRTWGVLTDSDVESLVFQQETLEQRAILASECLSHQLDILHSEPLGQIDEGEPRSKSNGSSGSSSPAPRLLSTPVAKASRLGIVTLLIIGSSFALGGCAQKAQPKQEFKLEILSTSALGSRADQPLPPALLDLIGSTPFAGKWVVHPQILRLDAPQFAPRDLSTDLSQSRDWVDNFWATEPSASQAMSLLRTRWSGEKLADLALPAPKTPAAADVDRVVTERARRATEAGALVIAFAPGGQASAQRDAGRMSLGHELEVPVFANPAKARGAIEAALARGVQRVVALYGVSEAPGGAPALAANPTASANPTAGSLPAPAADVPGSATATRSLRIHTIDSERDMMSKLASSFLEPRPDGSTAMTAVRGKTTIDGSLDGKPLRVEILVGPVDAGVSELASGDCDALLAGRSLDERELARTRSLGDLNSREAEFFPGMDGVAVCVAVNSPVHDSLNLAQVARIFGGSATRWEDVLPGRGRGSIRAHAPSDGSGIVELASEKANFKVGGGITRHSAEASVASAVADDPNAIGLISLAHVPANLRPLEIGASENSPAFEPSSYNVATQYYPLCRRLVFILPPVPAPSDKDATRNQLARRFIHFAVRSREGQEVIAREGLVTEAIRVEPKAPTPSLRAPTLPVEYAKVVESAKPVNVAIRFRSNENTLDNYSLGALDALATNLKGNPAYAGARLILIGFTDDIGKEPDNKLLSERRAAAVAATLKARGVTPEVVCGFGDRLSVASNATLAGRALNRRVEIWVKRSGTMQTLSQR